MKFSLFYFSDNGATTDQRKYRLLIEGAQFADAHGLAAVWTPERHFAPFGGLYPNPALTSAALAVATKRISIRAGSVIIPLHNPIRVAEEWSVVDNLSGGRVGVSLGRGWNANDFVLAPHNFRSSREIMYDSLSILRKLWRGESIQLRDGNDNEFKTLIYPRPLQRELPIWITAESDATFAKAGELGANVLTHLVLRSVEDLQRGIRLYHRSLSAAGLDPQQHEVTLMMHTFLASDHGIARREIEKAYSRYVENYLAFLSLGRHSAMTSEDEAFIRQRAVDRLFTSHGIVGTPLDCVQRVLQAQAAGVTEIACLIDFGIDTEIVLASLKYIAELQRLVNS